MRETGGLELASTITLVFQANRLTKCASHPEFNEFETTELWQPLGAPAGFAKGI